MIATTEMGSYIISELKGQTNGNPGGGETEKARVWHRRKSVSLGPSQQTLNFHLCSRVQVLSRNYRQHGFEYLKHD